jgi:DNA-binding response OmpR family regulator
MKKIIVVDDDAGIQEAFNLIFSKNLYEITIYPDATPVMNIQPPFPDLFILDKQLTGIDGLDICRLLKKRIDTMHIPVIILSASPHIKRLAKEAGADAVVEKPFGINMLRDAVNGYLTS